MYRRHFLIGLPLALSACTQPAVFASEDAVTRAIYREPGDTYLRLYTMKNTVSDNGAHTALLINASQRVVFDPAGSFVLAQTPERHDVLFGMSPRLEEAYVSFHARVTYYVTTQTVRVPPEVAERALSLALSAGPVAQASCARSTSRLLGQLPGLESIRVTWSPNRLEDSFARLPGVVTEEFRETDSADKTRAAAEIAAQLRAEQ